MSNRYDEVLRDELLSLADAVFSGIAASQDCERLDAILSAHEAARAEFVRYAMLNSQLHLSNLALTSLTNADVSDDTSVLRRAFLSDVTEADVGWASGDVEPHTSQRAPQPPASADITFGGKVLCRDRGAGQRLKWFRITTLMFVVTAILAFALYDRKQSDLLRDAERTETHLASRYDARVFPLATVGLMDGDETKSFTPTTLSPAEDVTRFVSASGADVSVASSSLLGVGTGQSGVLFQGSVRARLDQRGRAFEVISSHLRVIGTDAQFQVTQRPDKSLVVHVTKGEIEVQRRVRSPIFYWNFDRESESNVLAERNRFVCRATPTTGLVGSGAILFNNEPQDVLRVLGGRGKQVGTGDMACSSGISIEALIAPKWNGELYDYDEIFRKEDGTCRTLLSFQNDEDNCDFDTPEVPEGPCLAFGLNLVGNGYSELDMPLDGREGRPSLSSLCDGELHHVVATYDSFTGIKAIYVDGKRCFAHQFPVGSLILNGGPAYATIGSYAAYPEPFTGVIDEVAYYDFALTAAEIDAHYAQVLNGVPYVTNVAGKSRTERWRSVTRIEAGEERIIDAVTGHPSSDRPTVDREEHPSTPSVVAAPQQRAPSVPLPKRLSMLTPAVRAR